jgi:hypothetical protein
MPNPAVLLLRTKQPVGPCRAARQCPTTSRPTHGEGARLAALQAAATAIPNRWLQPRRARGTQRVGHTQHAPAMPNRGCEPCTPENVPGLDVSHICTIGRVVKGKPPPGRGARKDARPSCLQRHKAPGF